MAINPNTNFTTLSPVSADQMNRFPRGVMAYTERTTQDLSITAEEVQITGASFTAVANRYYKVTYYEPNVSAVTATSYSIWRIRLTNLTGAQKNIAVVQLPTAGVTNAPVVVTWVGTLTAGVTNFVATGFSQVGTAAADRAATSPAFLMVEDIGPA